jgi:hypothetical protein
MAAAAAPAMRPSALEPLASLPPELGAPLRELHLPPPPLPPAVPPARPPAARATAPAAPRKPAPPSPPPIDLGEARREVAGIVERLLAPANAELKSLRLTQQLLAKRTRVPPAMLKSMHPFVQEIASALAPALARLAPYRGVSAETVRLLETHCAELLVEDPSPKQMIDEFPAKVDWLLRFLEQVRSVTRDA